MDSMGEKLGVARTHDTNSNFSLTRYRAIVPRMFPYACKFARACLSTYVYVYVFWCGPLFMDIGKVARDIL